MARVALFCVLLVAFATSAYAACSTSEHTLSEIGISATAGSLTIDASGVEFTAGLAGSLSFVTAASGAGKVTIEYFSTDSISFEVDNATRTITVGISVTPPPPTDAASRVSVTLPLALVLAAIAFLAQRGSFAAVGVVFAVALAVAVVSAQSTCDASGLVHVTIAVDTELLDKATLKLPAGTELADITTSIESGKEDVWSLDVPTACTSACSYVFTNTIYGCTSSCGSNLDNASGATCDKANKQCVLSCAATHLNCDGRADTGCETLRSSLTDCGSCDNDCTGDDSTDGSCQLTGTTYACKSVCKQGYDDCDTNGSCETSTLANNANCGTCGNDCSTLPGTDGNAVCTDGVCVLTGHCLSGHAECDTAVPGCEALNDNTNCGVCGNTCEADVDNHADSGVCESLGNNTYDCKLNCTDGYSDCDSGAGCESDTSSDIRNCGGCQVDCTALLGVNPDAVTCVDSKCVIGNACDATHLNCDSVDSNGCEVNVDADPLNCGDCNKSCTDLPGVDPTSATCLNRVCQGITCLPPNDACGVSIGVSGCPVDTSTDPLHCGACGSACSPLNVDEATCVDSKCDYGACNPGFNDCDGDRTNGCESEAAVDKHNCGTCTTDCEVAGLTTIQQGDCVSSVCTVTCAANRQDCDADYKNGCEVDLLDTKTCGGCTARDCDVVLQNAANFTCNVAVGGNKCNLAPGGCDPGYAQCGAGPFQDTGCLTDIAGDNKNCGGCGELCSTPTNNVAPSSTCTSGVCDLTACNAGFIDCNGQLVDGCETSTTRCQGRTVVGALTTCSRAQNYTGANINFDCSTLKMSDASLNLAKDSDGCDSGTGRCVIQCVSGWSNCNNDPSDGCETQDVNCGGSLTEGSCQTAKKDINGDVSCLALTDPLNPISLTIDQSAPAECNSANGLCTYTCDATHFDCDQSAVNGCEVSLANCPSIKSIADCTFDKDFQCSNLCLDCGSLSGLKPNTSTCQLVGGEPQCVFSANACDSKFCQNLDGDWSNGCEAAMAYINVIGIGVPVDCSTDVDLTHVKEGNSNILCDGDPANVNTAGRCLYTCATGWADCDGSPFNGCESSTSSACGNKCIISADTSCGKNKCVDCSLILGTLGVDYQNPFYASASASTCVADDLTVDPRLRDYVCDTSAHYLHPRFDPPNGDNGACQAELCRDLDFNWENGCETAQLYGRGKRYNYGDNTDRDIFSVPYVPDPYHARFYEYFVLFRNTLLDPRYILDIPSTAAYSTGNNDLANYNNLNGYEVEKHTLNYVSVDSADHPEDWAIIPDLYLNPVDCILSEWSDWGLCTWADDCPHSPALLGASWLRSRIRTRQIVRQASGGGECHLPLVEDFYRFTMTLNQDDQHGGGLGTVVDYSSGSYLNAATYDISLVKLFTLDIHGRPQFTGHIGSNVPTPTVAAWARVFQADPDGAYPGNDDYIVLPASTTERAATDRDQPFDYTNYPDGELVTCAPLYTCPTQNVLPVACNISSWSAWTDCSTLCDGDWGGGVRIRTRKVNSGTSGRGDCFVDEFDSKTGEALHEWSGLLYQEEWQCNDFSCSGFNCTLLADSKFAEDHNIYLGADAILPQCDGRDWPEYVTLERWCDDNGDHIDVNFPLYEVLDSFSYEYRWPGHCIYECVDGWYDCNHDPRDGCETDGDYCTFDAENGASTMLWHPNTPWDHPWGECTLAWKHHPSGVVFRKCDDPVRNPQLLNTEAVCIPATGKCDETCLSYYPRKGTPEYVAGAHLRQYARCGDIVKVDGVEIKQCVEVKSDILCGPMCDDCTAIMRLGVTGNGGVCKEDRMDNTYYCERNNCVDGCHDYDENALNGCEVADYRSWPYPDDNEHDEVVSEWSEWSNCTYADNCGFNFEVFRNVPIQTRVRVPLQSAYNGGMYFAFSAISTDQSYVDFTKVLKEGEPESNRDVKWPEYKKKNAIPTSDCSVYIDPIENLGKYLLLTQYVESRICDVNPPNCVDCTNQLESHEVHCELSDWSKWSACNSECAVSDGGLIQPYQLRYRSVITPASKGGRCPPPGDTWQLAEAQALPNFVDEDYFAPASYLVDVQKCNSDECVYPEDCDALNYWYPGHFNAPAACRDSRTYPGDITVTGGVCDPLLRGCNALNGYCDDPEDVNDFRDGCESYVYPTSCGGLAEGSVEYGWDLSLYSPEDWDNFVEPTPSTTIENAHFQCSRDTFRDCTVLPGVTSPYAAACLADPAVGTAPSSGGSYRIDHHYCDLRWACSPTLCNDKNKGSTNVEGGEGWLDGCEEALNYKYPFVSLLTTTRITDPVAMEHLSEFYDTDTHTNDDASSLYRYEPIYRVYNPINDLTADNSNGPDVANSDIGFYDILELDATALSLTTGTFVGVEGKWDFKSTYKFNCRAFLDSERFCADRTAAFQDDQKDAEYDAIVEQCNLEGSTNPSFWEDEDFAFTCHGASALATAGTCGYNCRTNYTNCDLDPRNACETDIVPIEVGKVEENHDSSDGYTWSGNCTSACNIMSDNSCGADLCIDCAKLPGVLLGAGVSPPTCTLVEELGDGIFGALSASSEGPRIPVLNDNDFHAIQYACGVYVDAGTYNGRVDFRDELYCTGTCKDLDGDWRNGCENGMGYKKGGSNFGNRYDDVYDPQRKIDAGCDWNFLCSTDDTDTEAECQDRLNTARGTVPTPATIIAPCHKRSSGFDNPIPGAWFTYANVGIVSTKNPEILGQFIADVVTAFLATTPAVEDFDTFDPLGTRSFDCSLIYSTKRLYKKMDDGSYEYSCGYYTNSDGLGDSGLDCNTDDPDKFTFAQVHHVDVNGVLPQNICNPAVNNGQCVIDCAVGWEDFDKDPSNGCEADVSINGPCHGIEASVGYSSTKSCGYDCVSCETLSGTYTIPKPRAECLTIDALVTEDKWERDYLAGEVYVCSTEFFRVNKESDANVAYSEIVCDPRACVDRNFEHSDGCEAAVGYPKEWFVNRKYAHYHKYEVDQIYVRRRDLLWVFDESRADNGNLPTVDIVDEDLWAAPFGTNMWTEVFHLGGCPHLVQGDTGAVAAFPYTLVGGNAGCESTDWLYPWDDVKQHQGVPHDLEDFVFHSTADLYEAVGHPPTGTVFEFHDESGTRVFEVDRVAKFDVASPGMASFNVEGSYFDCSTALISRDGYKFNLGTDGAGGNLELTVNLRTCDPGPWFRVNQSQASICFPGWNPGAPYSDYSAAAGGAIGATKAGRCRAPFVDANDVKTVDANGNRYDYMCFLDWTQVEGAGKCKLSCETKWADCDGDPSNGCESYLSNGWPLDVSACGTTVSGQSTCKTNNWKTATSCGAGYCLNCGNLGGINKTPNNPEKGGKSTCIDGGADWKVSDDGLIAEPVTPPVSAIQYPADYYCTNVINDNACARAILSYKCVDPTDTKNCPQESLYSGCTTLTDECVTAAVMYNGSPALARNQYIPACEDRNEVWQDGCEVALGYNLKYYNEIGTAVEGSSVSPLSQNPTTVLVGIYDRSVGVKPTYDKDFKEIGYPDADMDGFDCEVLRAIPRKFSHVKPYDPTVANSRIVCDASVGTCNKACETGWSDCDGNPWNGCETYLLFCGGQGGNCDTPQQYPTGTTVTCSGFNPTEYDHSIFCDGGRVPYGDWVDIWGVDTVTPDTNKYDSAYYLVFEMTDNGMDSVDAFAPVDPNYSRYTIKGYWDGADIDASCRVWATVEPPAGVNNATGLCVLDCSEVQGYTNCDNNDGTKCESHTVDERCRSSLGQCLSCKNLPGVASTSSSHCLAGTAANPLGDIVISWPKSSNQGGGTLGHTVTYDSPDAEWPICDTRGATATGTACNDQLCRDYDGDWENGCEYPVNYAPNARASWEWPGVLYATDGSSNGGFDCSWINDPQVDAGGRDYGKKTFAQKYHIDTSGTIKGNCLGSAGDAKSGKCQIVCAAGWDDCDLDPTNGCETDQRLCSNCKNAKGYPDYLTGGAAVDCTTLDDDTRGFVKVTNKPICLGREGETGLCGGYFCNVFDGYCDSGLAAVLNSIGCLDLEDQATRDDGYCGADWNWRSEQNKLVPHDVKNLDGYLDLEAGDVLPSLSLDDYYIFDSTGRCADCSDLSGYSNGLAYCESDPTIAGNTRDQLVYFKPSLSVDLDSAVGTVRLFSIGNTVGEFLCQLHGELNEEDDGACNRDLCVDEDYFWANGCETAVNYNMTKVVENSNRRQPFIYHFAYNRDGYEHGEDLDGILWPNVRQLNRGVWCPFLQVWSLTSDDYVTGDCKVFPCPHLDNSTIDNWITCDDNATSATAGKCTYVCNTDEGWEDCDGDPLTGCETDTWDDGTCGVGCEKIACNDLPGLNPYYWSSCNEGVCELPCGMNLDPAATLGCVDRDMKWATGCETATNYPDGEEHNCETIGNDPLLHIRYVQPCNGEPGNHWYGKCEFECEPGWHDCNGVFSDGCESDFTLCQDCTFALGYVTLEDWYFTRGGADGWIGVENILQADWSKTAVPESTRSDGRAVNYGTVYGYEAQRKAGEFKLLVDGRDVPHFVFNGPEPPYGDYYNAEYFTYVAGFDCSTLSTTYPGHFKNASSIKCDGEEESATAGLCTFTCDNDAGYYDCDGDPRNGCEHQSLHEACGFGGECRNCYTLSGVDYKYVVVPTVATPDVAADSVMGYPVLKDNDGDNDAKEDIYDYVRYTGYIGGFTAKAPSIPAAVQPFVQLGCVKADNTTNTFWGCNLKTCVSTVCADTDLLSRTGCEVAQKYDFKRDGTADEAFDCSELGPNGDLPLNTTDHTLPSYHVLQVSGTSGCDLHGEYADKYGLRRVQFDDDGSILNDGAPEIETVGGDTPGQCYYECQHGYADCDGDPRNGCEINLNWCEDGDDEIGWLKDPADVKSGPSNGCEVALGYTGEELQLDQNEILADLDGIFEYPCSDLLNDPEALHINSSAPIYCQGGQLGSEVDKGRCVFTCLEGWQDCDRLPKTGCEAPSNLVTSCNCANCEKLPGLIPQSLDTKDVKYTVADSKCEMGSDGEYQCTLNCDPALCVDRDGDWRNGCEEAQNYNTTREEEVIGKIDCDQWQQDLLLAKKHHIDIATNHLTFCDGRSPAIRRGLCEFYCYDEADGHTTSYQDCDGDPRNGCEEALRFCSEGQAVDQPRLTKSDRCSKALIYECENVDGEFLDSLDQFCVDPATRLPYLDPATSPSFDCFDLLYGGADAYHIDNSTILPYCDRDPTHIETRGDCVFQCKDGYANCNKLATDGCEAQVNDVKTCSTSCINCAAIDGIDTDPINGEVTFKCVDDGANSYKCEYRCKGQSLNLDGTVKWGDCADIDGDWRNGCEVALNIDSDRFAVFMNTGEPMNCNVMQLEAYRNPDLFKHHLHIDLRRPVPTVFGYNLVPGSIFCNGGIHPFNPWSNEQLGKCYFECVEGFENLDRYSDNGCEAARDDLTYDYEDNGIGGFLIGDPWIEDVLDDDDASACVWNENIVPS